ncbi:aminoglycoside N(3)-acetyltransferase [Paenibacillus cymbidii]|uniref:aminoglycoside N(3)-acetyltransferase n=1 Tax=Paenibacillus cymbidii TaxID=1639034 RepID=UPI00108215BF|nr:AAC(3) family N-acetyltransferase [Paenibacillus cymbidii]
MAFQDADWPLSIDDLTVGLTKAGVEPGMTMLVHSSLKSFGRWIIGGPAAVVLALEQTLGETGTLVMPAHSGDLSDPAMWSNPPVPEAWWPAIRERMPAYEPDLTPTRSMGAVAECFRKRSGALRSGHPQVSFAAKGPGAAAITDNHSLADCLGERSPLARLYDCGAWVLLVGVGYDRNTSLHLAEYRAAYPGKRQIVCGAPIVTATGRQWATFDDVDFCTDDFLAVGEAFERESGAVRSVKIGEATIRLMPQRELIDFAVRWMEQNRR